MDNSASRQVSVEMELRVSYEGGAGDLSRLLTTLRESGGAIRGHLVFRQSESSGMVALVVCEKPTEGALALRADGFAVDTETVVVVHTERRPGALSHLVRTLEAEGLGIAYSYATTGSDNAGSESVVIFRTDDNPRAEDVLRNYLLPIDDPPSSGDAC